VSQEAHDDAKRRMVHVGANGINWIGIVSEWTPDYRSPEREAVVPGLLARGGSVGLSLEYLLRQRASPGWECLIR